MSPEERAQRAVNNIISVSRKEESLHGSIDLIANEIRAAVDETREDIADFVQFSDNPRLAAAIRAKGKEKE